MMRKTYSTYAKELVGEDDAMVVQDHLSHLGFKCTRLPFSDQKSYDVDNLFATIGTTGKHLAFAGHTDVVPPGNEKSWKFPPFSGTIENGKLYGRGSEDMKSNIACFISATNEFISKYGKEFGGKLSFIITGDEEKLAVGLSTLHEEDPTFIYHVDPELHQTVISGQGELHLQVSIQRLQRRFGIEIETFKPRIPFRETIKGKSEAKYRHKKQSGGAGQFAEVWMRIEPKERGEGVEFVSSLVGQNVDRVFVPSVEKGVLSACEDGVLAKYRVVDLKVDFYDGKQHPVDSKDIAFQIAGKGAFKEAFNNAQPCLLEPIMDVEVRVPEDFMGDVMGDVSSRRGKIMGMDSEGSFQVIKAKIPQSELYHYSTVIRSLTGGRGLHSESFSHYEYLPQELQKRFVTESQIDDSE